MVTNSNSTYNKVYAKYYDVLSQHKDYALEAKSLDKLIESLSITQTEPLIDIGCGTGNHSIRLSSLRKNPINGFDVSSDMISQAKSKQSKVDFCSGNMEKISSERYGFAFSLFNVVNCLHTIDALTEFLTQINRILKNDRYFFFECWHQEVVLENPPVKVERKFLSNGQEYIRVAQPDLSGLTNGRLKLKYQIKIIAEDRSHKKFSSVHNLRLFSLAEIDRCLKIAGFQFSSCHSALPELAQKIKDERMISILAKK